MSFLQAKLHFDSAVGLTTVDFSLAIEIEEQLRDFQPLSFGFWIRGAFGRTNEVSLFLRLSEDHRFKGVSGTSIYGFTHDTFRYFETGELSKVDLYPFGRGALEYEDD